MADALALLTAFADVESVHEAAVGAGQVLRDLLADGTPCHMCGCLRCFARTPSRRSSPTPTGSTPEFPRVKGLPDFFRFACEEAEDAATMTVDVVANRIPRRFGLDPRADVQMLAPMHRGHAGAGALNGLLQEALTPARPGTAERRFGGRVFRVGDKASQIHNNYDKPAAGVFNGTLNVVTALDPVELTLTVRTDEGETIGYEFTELDELVHAYALTIHRSQGSEYPAVVVPIT